MACITKHLKHCINLFLFPPSLQHVLYILTFTTETNNRKKFKYLLHKIATEFYLLLLQFLRLILFHILQTAL